ncbi:MAG TPA: IS1380 family transposase [Streptosporangiaceae bacterium]
MGRVREIRRLRRRVRVGAPDPSLTRFSGLVAVTEMVDHLNMIKLLDRAIGSIKTRDRGFSGGELLVAMAAAQLAGEDFLVGLDRQRADAAGKVLAPVAGLCSTTAAGLARRFTDGQWHAVETGIGDIGAAMLAALPAERAAALCEQVTIDLDTTDVEVYGRHKRAVAYNYQGQRCGRPHVATWAETATVLAADLMAGNEDPRPHAGALLNRALAALPARARAGRILLRADAGYFAGQLARAALFADVEFAIGAKRVAPLWRILSGVGEDDWTDAIDMDDAQVAVAEYCPDWWPATTRLLIRRVALAPEQVSADPRSRRRRTLHPAQRALPIADLAGADAIYAYSFVVTNLDVSTPERTVAVEHWYRHRTQVENVFRDAKHGAALRHLPSGYPQVNKAWMWGALLAVSIAGWLHQLTATPGPTGEMLGHGVRDGQAMIATLRHRLICVPARLVRHAGALTLRLPPGQHLLEAVLARIRRLPATS